jgi:hypothetical protein
MMRQPTLFLTVGLPCPGKTTAARRRKTGQNALRLTKDDWVKALYGHENPPSAQDVIEGRLIQMGLSAASIDIPTPGELDGSEPIDDPTGRIRDLEQWRRHRWPPSVS